MKTILFLDFDGVMRPFKETKGHFNRECVKVLNEIIAETSCDLVITSDWRLFYTFNEIKSICEDYGISKAPIDITLEVPFKPDSTVEENRAREIQMYIDSHEVDFWCAIDDLHLKMKNSILITASVMKGITQTGVKPRAIKLLNNE